jgi:hypothetical protein
VVVVLRAAIALGAAAEYLPLERAAAAVLRPARRAARRATPFSPPRYPPVRPLWEPARAAYALRMYYAPRTIALHSEILHPVIEPDHGRLQKLHNQLYTGGHPTYTDFAVVGSGAVLSNPVSRPGAASSAAFGPDRMAFREELGSLTVEEFARRVRTIAELATGLLGIQVLTAQQVTIRTLVNPRNFKDSRAYLKQGMFGFSEETEDFGREPQLYGIRLVFPFTEESPSAHALRIESFHSDARSLFLENQASFPPLLVARGLAPLEQNVLDAYQFLVERALAFVGRFDVRETAT